MPDWKVTKVYSHTLAGALTLSALAGGAIHLPFVVAYATLVVLSGCIALAAGHSARGRVGAVGFHGESAGMGARIDVGAGVWSVLALVCLLQTLPVPLPWLAHVAPLQADIWERVLRPFGAPAPEHAPLSLAPWRTLVEALKLASYAVIFQLSARLGRQGMGRIAALAFASALCVAMVTLGHRAYGATRLFGIYTPSDTLAVAPILNPNSRAGYENLGFFCGLGLLFRARPGPRAAFLGVGLLLLVVDILLCQSRGGTACLVLGMSFMMLLRRSDAGKPRELAGAWQLGVVAAIAVCATGMALVSRPRGGLGFEEPLEKLEVFRRAARLVFDHPGLGVGRGAFGSAFSTYQPRAGAVVFEHVENLPLQWAADFGVPVAVLALGALGWAVWPVFSRSTLQSPVRRGALVGVLVLLLQNLVDLGLEITAIAALWVYVLGGLAGAARAAAAPGAPRREPRELLLPGSLGLMMVSLGLVAALGSDSPARERERLHRRLSGVTPTPGDWAALRAASLAYPADPYIPLVGASAALAAKRDALPWVARALERAPDSAPAHLALARALYARGAADQAVAALRRAIELDPDAAGPAIGLAFAWELPSELLVRAVPEGPRGARPLEIIADHSPAGSAQRVRWLEQALASDPRRVLLHHRIALELYQDVLRGERGVMCHRRRDECTRRAREHVRRAGPGPGQAVLEARLLELSSGAPAAEEQLVESCAAFVGDEGCARALVSLALKNQSPRLPAAVRASVAAGCATRESCAATHLALGRELGGAGQLHAAQSHFREATRQWPTSESWRALAATSTELGQPERAEDALRRAALLDAEKKGAQ